MAGEDTINVMMEGVTKAPEFLQRSAELAKFILEMLGKLMKTGANINHSIERKFSSYGKVIKAADEAKCGINQHVNIPKSDTAAITKLCKKRGIPVSFKQARGAKTVTAMFPENFTPAFSDVMSETLKNKLEVKPHDFSTLKIPQSEVSAYQSMLERHGVDATFVKNGNDIMCVFENKNRSSIERIQSEYMSIRKDLSESFKCGHNEKTGESWFADTKQGKTFLCDNFKTEAKIESLLRERLGYGKEKANCGARVFGASLTPEQLKMYQTDTRQMELLNGMSKNIKLENESILLRDVQFARTEFKADSVNKFIVMDNDRAVALIPSKMNREEMETVIHNKLGISDNETVRVICDKAETLNRKFSDKHKLNDLENSHVSLGIEKNSGKEFTVEYNGEKHKFNFSDKSAVKKLQNQFGISRSKAEEVFKKAKSQNTLANAVNRAKVANTARSPAPKVKPPKTAKKVGRK